MANPKFYVTINAISCVNNSFFMDFKRLNYEEKKHCFLEIDTVSAKEKEKEKERRRKK